MRTRRRPTPRRILDLPCGHGRVLRMLRAEYPDATCVACDLDPAAVEFCEHTFGVHGVVSTPDLQGVDLGSDFDLIWCGSLVTHLPRAKWVPLFRLFLDALAPGGVLIFTTHGRHVAELLRLGDDYYGLDEEARRTVLAQYDADGFGYADYAWDPGYGVSLSAPDWIVRELIAFGGLRLLNLVESGWDGHQDVVACERPSP